MLKVTCIHGLRGFQIKSIFRLSRLSFSEKISKKPPALSIGPAGPAVEKKIAALRKMKLNKTLENFHLKYVLKPVQLVSSCLET